MNLESETRKGYLISAKMKKVWAVEMELLKKLLEVCEKYHLRIWAEGGTLLGTIRHHGYIPWDDDIDMAMLREDYDKLQAIAKEEFKTPYFFQSGYTDLFPNGLSRIRKDGTAAIMDQAINRNYHQGIFIDIFPLDVMPDDEVLFKSFVKLINLFCSFFIFSQFVMVNPFVIGLISFIDNFNSFKSGPKSILSSLLKIIANNDWIAFTFSIICLEKNKSLSQVDKILGV